jgi:hypothetical protein
MPYNMSMLAQSLLASTAADKISFWSHVNNIDFVLKKLRFISIFLKQW